MDIIDQFWTVLYWFNGSIRRKFHHKKCTTTGPYAQVGNNAAGGSGGAQSFNRKKVLDANSTGMEEVFKPRLHMGVKELETGLMNCNKERQDLEHILMRFPSNSAGKTLYARKQKQEAEKRLLEVEKEITEIRMTLREQKVYTKG